jgi:hypothetical protein
MVKRRFPIREPHREHHRWAVYLTTGTPAKLVGFIDAPDKETAIRAAIKDCKVPPNERGRLIARCRD